MTMPDEGDCNSASDGERLNLEAYEALAGLCDQSEGQDRLAKLLRSDAKIDPIVRKALAEALSPNGEKFSGVALSLSNLGAGNLVRKMQTQSKKLNVGRRALQLIAPGNKRIQAEVAVAELEGRSQEYVKKAIDYARKFAAWEGERASDDDTQQAQISRQALFHTAAIEKADPTEYAENWYD